MEKGGSDSEEFEYHRDMAKAKKRAKKSKKTHHFRRIIVGIVLILFIAGLGAWLVPLAALSATTTIATSAAPTITLPWPIGSEAAIGAQGYGVLSTYGLQKMLPTASVAKIITSLTVLKQYPLSIGQQGPTITLGAADVANYAMYLKEQGSVIPIVAGEQITEYQALQAMLLPSANNMADSLATWAFGSLPNYVIAANKLLQSLGLTSTVVSADASGYLPGTESSASDLVKLGEVALNNPVIANIVAQTQASLPVAGIVNNVNHLLGQDGIIGIKTGNTQQAGGVYLFAAKHLVSPGNSVTIIGAIMNAPTLSQALSDSEPLLNAVTADFVMENVIQSGEIVGYYKAPWNGVEVDAAASKNIAVPVWRGSNLVPQVSLNAIYAPKDSGSIVGSISVSVNGSSYYSPVTLSRTIANPPWYWRLLGHFSHSF